MDGEKDILVFSDAGGTGRSYHAAQTAKNQKRRRHYLLEPGWRADAAIQGLGRTHRSAQVSAPFFRVCTTDVHGEKRFTSTIARRLDQLGALTKGQRETGSQGMFRAEDNLESPIARAALRGYYADLAAGRAEAMRYEAFTDWTALRLIDKDGVLLEELAADPALSQPGAGAADPHAERALCRVHAPDRGSDRARPRRRHARSRGRDAARREDRADLRRGSLDLPALRGGDPDRRSRGDGPRARPLAPKRRWSGTRTSWRWSTAPRVARRSISARPMQMYDEEIVTLMRKVTRPTGSTYLEEEKFETSAWEQIEAPEFTRLWTEEADSLPKFTTTKLYLLTGLLLPIWKDMPTGNERIYRVTPEGCPSMIGRTVSEDGAAALRARFLVGTPKTPQDMLTAALGSTAPVDLGRGLTLTRRRVAGGVRLEIDGADRGTIDGLKALGCFTEIIAFQLRVFVPHGEGVDTAAILSRITGAGGDGSRTAAA